MTKVNSADMPIVALHGHKSLIDDSRAAIVRSQEGLESMWKAAFPPSSNDHDPLQCPSVDFQRHMVIAVFEGKCINCDGLKAEILGTDNGYILKYKRMSFSSLGEPPSATPFSIFVVLQDQLPIVIQRGNQCKMHKQESWTTRATIEQLPNKAVQWTSLRDATDL